MFVKSPFIYHYKAKTGLLLGYGGHNDITARRRDLVPDKTALIFDLHSNNFSSVKLIDLDFGNCSLFWVIGNKSDKLQNPLYQVSPKLP